LLQDFTKMSVWWCREDNLPINKVKAATSIEFSHWWFYLYFIFHQWLTNCWF
jgi:hypothetical protein